MVKNIIVLQRNRSFTLEKAFFLMLELIICHHEPQVEKKKKNALLSFSIPESNTKCPDKRYATLNHCELLLFLFFLSALPQWALNRIYGRFRFDLWLFSQQFHNLIIRQPLNIDDFDQEHISFNPNFNQ